MKRVFVVIIFLALLNACSSDDSNDNESVIGQWQMIERYESNVEVEVGCSQYYYIEFKSDNVLSGGYIDFDTTPAECSVVFDLSLWRRSGNNYEIYVDPNDIQSVAFFDGDNLVIETTSVNLRTVYQRL